MNVGKELTQRLKHLNDNIESIVQMKRLSTEIGIRVRLGELFGETKVEVWLHTPNAAFDNKRPIDLIHEDNSAPLYEMIYRVGSGEPT